MSDCCVTMGTGGQYVCQCTEGFTGYYCEDNIDDCVKANCEEYQVCVDLINSHR